MTHPASQSPAGRGLLVLALLMGLSPLAIDMYLPALPAMGLVLGAEPVAMQLTLTLYLAFYALPQLLFGAFSDALGRRRVMLAGTLLFAMGAWLAARALNLNTLLVARALQGIGAAAIIVVVPAQISDERQGPAFARAMSIVMVVMSVAPMMAPTLGALVLKWSDWRGIFLVQAMMALLMGALYALRMAETLVPQRRVPVQPRILGRHYRALLGVPSARGFLLCQAFAVAGMLAFLAGAPYVYMNLYGLSAQQFALVCACNSVALVACTLLGHRWAVALGSLRLLGLAMVSLGLSMLLLMLAALLARPPMVMLMLGSMLFIGMAGIINANSMSLILHRFRHVSGSASAMAGTLRFGLGALAPLAVGLGDAHHASATCLVMAACGGLAILSYWRGARALAQE